MNAGAGRVVRAGAIALACIAMLGRAGHAQAASLRLSPIEERMRAFVRGHEAEQIALLEKAVNISSGTMNAAGLRAMSRLFESEFAAIGFDTQWIALPDSAKRAGHFFAERRGSRGKRLLLIGHLDTVFEGDSEKFVRKDSLAYGAGTSDMKSGDLVILYALKALHSVGALDDTRIIVAMTGDEEDPSPLMELSRKPLVDAAKRSDIALGFEEDAGKGTVARRGIGSWQLTVTATQGHTSGMFSPSTSFGAIYEIARIISAFRERLSGEQYLTFSPGIILGGTNVTFDSTMLSGKADGKDNIVAPLAYAHGDLRFLTREQQTKAREAMRAIVEEGLRGTSATISFEDGTPSMPPTPGNYALLAVVDTVSRALGRGPVEALDPALRGAADISFVAEYVDAVDGLGAVGMRSHSRDEHVNLKTLVPATERAAVLIYRLTRAR
ncbi:MAG TPA: M20/M25/M40 family metallo-hydrolase [Gemmatimonadaceae bacterium]|nr:M20/M25/M40 family metallo-hydrolase [Gemmatimonadaceae bacterium]